MLSGNSDAPHLKRVAIFESVAHRGLWICVYFSSTIKPPRKISGYNELILVLSLYSLFLLCGLVQLKKKIKYLFCIMFEFQTLSNYSGRLVELSK